jgi:MOSC domain-containing protein YiiM
MASASDSRLPAAEAVTAWLISIQLGKIRTQSGDGHGEPAGKPWTTGFYKMPVDGPVQLTSDGVVGDQIADTKNHGGADKAVLAYAASHYDLWRQELAALQLDPAFAAQFGPGAFAENLTILGLCERNVCIGDVWQMGAEVQLQVSQPRQPCWKINRRWGVKTMTRRVAQSGRTGWYCRVFVGGRICAGDHLKLLQRPHPDWTVARANDVLMGRELDQYAAMELRSIDELATAWKKSLS